MPNGFTRALGAEPGVQLNPLRDNSEIQVLDNWDQNFAIAMRATRGRIDKPFKVNRNNIKLKLGPGESMRSSALNEAYAHVVEALNNGAYEAVVQRLATSAAAVKWAKVTLTPVGSGAALTATVAGGLITVVTVGQGGTGYTSGATITVTPAGGHGAGAVLTPVISAQGVITSVTIIDDGSGYTEAPTLTVVASAWTTDFAVSETAPSGSFLLSVKHLECFNDGIKLELRADEKKTGGVAEANDRVTLKIKDKDGIPLYEFSGSLDSTAIDDYGNSLYLPDVAASRTDAAEIAVGNLDAIPVASDCYGYDAYGYEQWAKSSVLVCFTEGGTGYAVGDYSSARAKLKATNFDYGYIAAGGTQSTALLAQLAQLAFDTNTQLRFDIPGSLGPDAAIAFVEQLNYGGSLAAHLLHGYWAPLKMDDPTGINPKSYFGRSTLNIALACRRNSQVNAKGFAPKNYPVAGRNWPINNAGIVQTYFPVDQERNALAKAKINPVLFMTFAGGGRYVYADSITSALVESSLIKLIAVAEMSTTVDKYITMVGNAILQLPMKIAVKRMSDALDAYLSAAQASDWIVPSNDPMMEGQGWKYEVKPDEVRPYDRMVVNTWIRYDGTVRQIFATQTLSR